MLAVVLLVVLSSASAAKPPAGEAAARAARPAAHGPTVRISGEFGGYADSDAVYVASPTVSLGVGDELAGWSLSGRYLVDAVSAASVDIVSSASGKWTEYRHVGSLAAELPAGPAKLSVSGGLSSEPDYLSIGGGATVTFDALEKNLTPFIGVSYGDDRVGRTGEPRTLWRQMQKVGAQLGATFVVNRSTIGGLSFDAIAERGYLAKPYRYVPLFAPGAAASLPPGASAADVNRLRLDQRPADALPDSRERLAVSGRIAHRGDGSTIRLDQRVYGDSWGVLASTTEARLWLDAGSRVMLGPHLRLHAQRGVTFWQRAIEATASPGGPPAPPPFRTGDRELGPLGTLTVGGGLRWRLSDANAAPLTLFLQADGAYTRFFDALYITRRLALFCAVGIDAELD